jgi:hypothetical protein
MELAKADIPRHLWTNMNIPDLEQSPDSFLQPGETLEDWDVSFRRPNADGGVQQLVAPSVDGSRPGYGGYDRDKRVLDAETIKKIKEKIKLKPGQKWNFYDPKTGKGSTFGVKKSDDIKLYDRARNIGTPGRLETKLKKAKETYKKIKADPDLLAQKKAYDRELYMGKREQVLEEARFKYATDKEFRKAKLEYDKIQRIENPEKYKKKMSDWYGKRGNFPPGNNYKENVWRDMFRSSQKKGQQRFMLVNEKGKLLTPDNFPKVDGKVRWDVGGAYKKVKFYDTKTKQFVKFDNTIKGKGIGFEKYLDQKDVGGKDAFKNATYGYKIKDDYKKLTFKDSKGKIIRLGTFIQDQLIDRNDFIKSGINVQHADLNNAFWKNEVSLASSNQELNKFEMNVERDLRAANKIDDVKLKNIARNKALGTFKKKIEKLPGGITKVIEGKTYGIKPTQRGLIQAAGKEFGATRYKDFANLLKKLCPKGQASGGRIGFADGPATVACGSKRLEQIILRGGANKTEQDLAKKILQAGRGLRGMFSLSGMFGPAATAFLVGAEAGLVGYDMISQGKTFREAVGDSVFNYALGDRTKIDPAEERYKRYAEQGFDVDKIRVFEKNIDRMNELKSQAGDLYKKANVVNIGGPRISDAIKQKQQVISDKAIAEIPLFTQDLFRTGEIPRLEKFLERNYVEGMKNISEADRLSEIDRLSNINPLAIGKIRAMEDEKRLRELKLQNPDVRAYMGPFPTMYGFASGGRAGYMGGGIAAIRKPHAIPPEKGGLRSIMINGKKS